MRVLSIDPGYDRLGVAVIEKREGKEHLLFSDCITTDKTMDISDRITALGDAVADILKKHKPDALAVETLFFNQNKTTALAVAQVRGIVMYLAHKASCTVYEYNPQEIKVAMTGYGKSDKKAVTDMVKKLVVNAPQKAFDDEYDAIAVGVTCLAHVRGS